LTGDYRFRVSGPFDQILPAFEALVDRVKARHGILAILGNHDGAGMVEPLEALGIRVLINETATIVQGGSDLHLTGTDDGDYFDTDEARNALARAPDGFKLPADPHPPEPLSPIRPRPVASRCHDRLHKHRCRRFGTAGPLQQPG
jgi:hypothetical protein